jgi:hypothetical protein
MHADEESMAPFPADDYGGDLALVDIRTLAVSCTMAMTSSACERPTLG